MLKGRSKRRYISIIHSGQGIVWFGAVVKRFSELFGTITTQKAAIKLVHSGAKHAIIRCKLEQIDNVLVAISMTDPPAVTLDISGTIKHLTDRTAYGSLSELH